MSFAANIIDYFNLNKLMIFVNLIFIMNYRPHDWRVKLRLAGVRFRRLPDAYVW